MDYGATSSMYDVLERLLHDESAEPTELPLSLLRAITNDFAKSRRIGYYDYSEGYKGVLRNGKVVFVKKMYESLHTDDERFRHELHCLKKMRAKHKNIVRFLGYCDLPHRLLCFEYLSGGNLHAHIADASHGLSWRKRYTIIKGICEGLCYLHKKRTVHLDLRPINICLDGKKVPKILHFGRSWILEEKQSKVVTDVVSKTSTMQFKYMAPELVEDDGVITLKADIYSLGFLITAIITGEGKYCILEDVLKSWAERLETSLEDTRLEQIQVCVAIAQSCMEHDPEKRPDAEHIMKMLVETERMDEFTEPDETTMALNILEHVLAGSEEPRKLDLLLLQRITDNFSEQRLIGVGGCGEVYKGILRNGDVAVKRLFKNRTIKDKIFHREVKSLFTARHENIVRLLGFCSFTKEDVSKFKGKIIMADVRERLLCLEYISNGNLDKRLTDELRGLEWHTRYDIILGICKGLLYLHKEKDIIHMDLKPANILLDDLMVPKITDFGLSRLDNSSQAVTTTRLMSPGYCAPEYFRKGKSSCKSDIYSLGVMITELVTGSKKEPDLTKVLRRWRHRWIKSSKHTPLGYQQVTKCLQLAQRCIQIDPTSRPDIVDITQELKAMDSRDDEFQVISPLEDMLGIEPLEIHFPFEPNQQISNSIVLSNDTDGYMAFMTKTRLRHFCIEPNKGIVSPRSKCSVTVKMQAQVDKLPNDHYKKKIAVLSTKVDGALAALDGAGDMFIGKDRNVVDKVNVMVAFDTAPLAEES